VQTKEGLGVAEPFNGGLTEKLRSVDTRRPRRLALRAAFGSLPSGCPRRLAAHQAFKILHLHLSVLSVTSVVKVPFSLLG